MACQLLRAPAASLALFTSGNLPLLELLRRGAVLALLVSVWPLILLGVVVHWWGLTPAGARAGLRGNRQASGTFGSLGSLGGGSFMRRPDLPDPGAADGAGCGRRACGVTFFVLVAAC